jgi:hypothetical protein
VADGVRWRRPARPVVEPDPESVFQFNDGEVRENYIKTYPVEDVERMRTGYLCFMCDEPFETPWPLTCGVCGYAVAEKQPLDFEREFQGERWIGPREDDLTEFQALKAAGFTVHA